MEYLRHAPIKLLRSVYRKLIAPNDSYIELNTVTTITSLRRNRSEESAIYDSDGNIDNRDNRNNLCKSEECESNSDNARNPLTSVTTSNTFRNEPMWSHLYNAKYVNEDFKTIARVISPVWNCDHVYGLGTKRLLQLLRDIYDRIL